MLYVIGACVLSVLLFPVADSSCPNSWTQFRTSCYAYVYEPTSWAGANAICRTFGGYPVEINSAIENNFVHNLIKSHAAEYAWIGANDLLLDGHWVLGSTANDLPYTNWQALEPNNALGKYLEGCAFMNRANGQWLDVSCSAQVPSVCERRAAVLS